VSKTYQVEQLVDEQKLGAFNLNLFVWSFLAMFADGFDISAMAFAAPELVRAWGLESAAFGPVFSASLIGIFFGAPLLGYIGDRFGRKRAIILASAICGAATLTMSLAGNLTQMFILRLIAGIGIGGLMPNTIALNSELSPARHRAMLIVLMFTGITLGGSTPSAVAAWLIPDFGWQTLFLIGGAVPLLLALLLAFVLPESIKYLALTPARRRELLRVARKMRPDIHFSDNSTFGIKRSTASESSSLAEIFSGGLRWITPLLWVAFSMTLMAHYFLGSWTPILFEQSGLDPEAAALASGLYHLGGAIGGLLISVLIDRYGFVTVALFLLAGCPVVVAIGQVSGNALALTVLSLSAGICVLGAQFGNNASAGLLYPTELRAKGVGLALSAGRIGSVIGPLVGGYLMGRQWPLSGLFAAAAVPLLVGVIAASVLTRMCVRRFGGLRLDDAPVGKET